MSTGQLAVKKVQSLSDTQAQAVLDWLAQQETARRPNAPPRAAAQFIANPFLLVSTRLQPGVWGITPCNRFSGFQHPRNR